MRILNLDKFTGEKLNIKPVNLDSADWHFKQTNNINKLFDDWSESGFHDFSGCQAKLVGHYTSSDLDECEDTVKELGKYNSFSHFDVFPYYYLDSFGTIPYYLFTKQGETEQFTLVMQMSCIVVVDVKEIELTDDRRKKLDAFGLKCVRSGVLDDNSRYILLAIKDAERFTNKICKKILSDNAIFDGSDIVLFIDSGEIDKNDIVVDDDLFYSRYSGYDDRAGQISLGSDELMEGEIYDGEDNPSVYFTKPLKYISEKYTKKFGEIVDKLDDFIYNEISLIFA